MELRKKSWDAIRYLRAQDDLPWICVGDFNEALFQADQSGGNLRSFNQMEDFRDFLAECGLADLGFSGYQFTWDNKREGDDNIQVRLDRAVCNGDFLSIFPETLVEHLMTEESDHQVILVRALETAPNEHARGPRPFRFEEAWTRHDQYDSMVEAAWMGADSGEKDIAAFCQRLARTAGSMQLWAREIFGSIRKQIKGLKA
ncbi:uncharacterized protein [Aegilops tauschii subsp. strangulata]|uniref:uncharacterized protein n=1 Tax=Aegilops tauschii subsp. strangulata TaxID=200361 RepID=UPI003CC88625